MLDRESSALAFGTFPDLVDRLRPNDVLVLNETRVFTARLSGAREDTGGKVELLLVRPAEHGTWWAMGRPRRALTPGRRVTIGTSTVTVLEAGDELLRVEADGDWDALIASAGHVPLPPYIRRADTAEDRERYQTVYARVPGAVAAPTAGLHFTDALLDRIRAHGVAIATVVLHVGPGTFKPVTAEDAEAHVLDAEWYSIPEATAAALAAARAKGGRIVAVGTTVTRTLETGANALPDEARANGQVVAAGEGWTRLLIVPGHTFSAVDALVTNFHLPRSSLLFLVSALAGRERVLAAYRAAIEQGFRFYSYGDAMLVI